MNFMRIVSFIAPLCLFLCCCTDLSGQRRFREHRYTEDRNKGKAFLFNVGVAGHQPGGDLADRFGLNGAVHTSFEQISEKNFVFGVGADFFFGSQTNEDPLAILRTPEGDIIGRDQAAANIFLRQRGLYTGAHVGKMFPLKKTKRAGIRVTFGAGWTFHKFRLQDDSRSVTQILDDYAKGYDRLTAGANLQQFIGWQHLGRLRRNNWMVGFDFHQGFTTTQRDWDFSEKKKLTGRRTDLRYGVKAVWSLPFYRQKAEEISY
jgi:hypothetical protein